MKLLRAVLALLAASAAVPGAWASFAPRSFYASFPGAGHHWVDRLGPFNAHLIADVGAFYLAFAVLLAWGAVRPAPAFVVPAAAAWSLFSGLHLRFHATHTHPLPSADALAQTVSLAAALAGGLAVLALSARRGTPPAGPSCRPRRRSGS